MLAGLLRCRRLALVTAAVVALSAACSSPKPPPPPLVVPPRALEISIEASPGLNPDLRDRPTPVVLRIYELRAPMAFESADFFALFEKDQATLGNELAAREELQLRPGETAKLAPRELKADVRAIGVFVAFRDLERAQWRAVMPLPGPPEATRTPPPKPIPVPVMVKLGPREVRVGPP